MIITKTPFRISFFGGGTDYPAWYRQHGGKVLGTTIDKYCYISCRELPPFFEHRHRIVYSRIENVRQFDEIAHPAVREVLRFLAPDRGLEIHHDGDLPARAGMGSSSSFIVGLLKALHAFEGRMIAKDQLFEQARHLEQHCISECVGCQDSAFAAFGGLCTIEFRPGDSLVVEPVVMSPARLAAFERKFLLFFSGITRNASEVAQDLVANLPQSDKTLHQMRALVDQALAILRMDTLDFSEFGRLLHETWMRKRALSSRISNPHLDEVYQKALKAGALGGKVLGAGGGGFFLFYAEPDAHQAIRQALAPLIEVPFRFSTAGAEVAVYEPRC